MTTVRQKLLTGAVIALAFPASAWATNGYFSHGTSVAEKGLAGAGAAYSQDTLAAANNPAANGSLAVNPRPVLVTISRDLIH